MAKKFSSELTKNGLVIVSGLALGIDTIAHQTCLEEGGKTIAVLGGGFHHIYPEENTYLAQAIVKNGGLLISQYKPEEQANTKNFPKRNKVISQVSQAVLVIEAGIRSGAKITAGYAKEQNKKVFVIPNPLDSKNAKGIQQLLEKGATMIFQSTQILSQIDTSYLVPLTTPVKLIDTKHSEENKIYQILLQRPHSINEIIQKMQDKPQQILQKLSIMEIEGVVENIGNIYRLKEKK